MRMMRIDRTSGLFDNHSVDEAWATIPRFNTYIQSTLEEIERKTPVVLDAEMARAHPK